MILSTLLMVACSHVMYAAAPDPLELDSRPAVTTRDATKMLEELESFLDCDIVADKLRFTKPPAALGRFVTVTSMRCDIKHRPTLLKVSLE
jgi:hypothetical protein